MLARIPCHPIDTLKSRIQAFRNPLAAASSTTAAEAARHTRIVAVLRDTLHKEGVRGLYRGFGITFLGSAPATCLYFTSYELVKDTLPSAFPVLRSVPAVGHFCAGMAAETVSCILWVPIDVIKERMQVQRRQVRTPHSIYYRNTADAWRQIMQREGLVGLYRGYGATIASFGPFSALYFVFYEWFKDAALQHTAAGQAAQTQAARQRSVSSKPAAPPPIDEAAAAARRTNATSSALTEHPSGSAASSAAPAAGTLPFIWQIITASAAGSAASLVTNPLDLAKLRLQVQRGVAAAAVGSSESVAGPPLPQYRNSLHAMATIAREEGARALFRGAGARMAFHAPSTAITMTLFEQCKGLFQQHLAK
jgi:hypothetical protein